MLATTIAFSALAATIGLVAGIVLGLNGFAQPAGTTALNQAPRIKNLGWLLSGFFVMYLADQKKIGIPSDLPLIWPFVGYGFGAVLGVVLSVGWMIRSITRSVEEFNNQDPGGPGLDPGTFQREYLTYGKSHFDSRWKQAKDEALQLREEAEIAARHRELQQQADSIALACMYNTLGRLQPGPGYDEWRDTVIDTILQAICVKVRAESRKPIGLKASLMAFVARDEASHLRDRALFTAGMPDNYLGYLELKRGGQHPVRRGMVLPVAEQPNAVLPGAPEAVLNQEWSIVNLHDIRFAPRVAADARKAMADSFKDPYFSEIASITSVPVYGPGAIYGVINIASSKPDLLGDKAEARAVIQGFLPLVALLSALRFDGGA